MLKNEKGITLIMLTITIIVMIILAGVLVYSGNSLIQSAKLQTTSTKLLFIQAKARTLSEKSEFEGKSEGILIGNKLETVEGVLTNIGITNITENDKYYLLSEQNLTDMGLSQIKEDNKYIVNYNDMEVYYIDGYKTSDGNIHYKLSEITNMIGE